MRVLMTAEKLEYMGLRYWRFSGSSGKTESWQVISGLGEVDNVLGRFFPSEPQFDRLEVAYVSNIQGVEPWRSVACFENIEHEGRIWVRRSEGEEVSQWVALSPISDDEEKCLRPGGDLFKTLERIYDACIRGQGESERCDS